MGSWEIATQATASTPKREEIHMNEWQSSESVAMPSYIVLYPCSDDGHGPE
jgi:hypothetical protein